MSDMVTPISEQERVSALDVARGFALLGILVMNSTGMALYSSAFSNFLSDGGTGPLNFAAWASMTVYFEGAMRGLFSLLFGAGIVVFLSRMEAKQMINSGDIHARRMLWLLGFGLINAIVFMYPYDILFVYGVAGLALFPFRKLAPKFLFAIAAAGLLVLTVSDAIGVAEEMDEVQTYAELSARVEAGEELTEDEQSEFEDIQSSMDGWNGTDDLRAEEVEYFGARDVLGQYERAVDWFMGFLTDAFFWEFLLDATILILIGMALARNGVLLNKASDSVYLALLVGGYGVGLALGLWRAVAMTSTDFVYAADGWQLASYQARRVALALGHVGLIYLMVRRGVLPFMQKALGAVGRMAFTNYMMQSVIQVVVWYGPFLALHGQVERYQVWFLIVPTWIFQMWFSLFWLSRYRYGPLEWLWRGLTYVTVPPLKKG